MKLYKIIPIFLALLFTACNESTPPKNGVHLNETKTELNVNNSSNCGKLPPEILAYFNIDWRVEYKHMLEIYHKDGYTGTPWGMPMYFLDIDGDNSYELLAKIGSYASGEDLLFIYDCINNNVKYKGVINGGFVANNDESQLYLPKSYFPKNIVDIYYNKDYDSYCLLSCVNYSNGGVYGYDFYLNQLNDLETYYSTSVGCIFAETGNYTPPFEWHYTLDNIEGIVTEQQVFEENIQNLIKSYELIQNNFLEVRLYADNFVGDLSIEDSEYENIILQLKEELYSKYFE